MTKQKRNTKMMRQAPVYRNSRVCKIRTAAGNRAAVVAKSAQVGREDTHTHTQSGEEKRVVENKGCCHIHKTKSKERLLLLVFHGSERKREKKVKRLETRGEKTKSAFFFCSLLSLLAKSASGDIHLLEEINKGKEGRSGFSLASGYLLWVRR